jgi:hypothetical protein
LLGGNTCPYNSRGDLFNFIITAYGIHPSCGHARVQRGSHTNNYLIKDQVAPEHIWGLIHQGTRPRINPCLRHGYPGIRPGALDISRDLTHKGLFFLVPDQEPQSSTGGPHKGLFCLVPNQEPQSSTGGPHKGLFCLVPDQEPQSSTGGPHKGLFYLVPDQEPQSSTRGRHKGLLCLVSDQEPQSSTGGPHKGLLPWL